MSSITYKQGGSWVLVYLAGKKAGTIREVTSPQYGRGFRYVPLGSDAGGDWFPTLAACKKSLEAE